MITRIFLEDFTMESIGSRIKLLREQNNLNQKQFAERIMVSQSYLSRMERGSETPNNKLIKLIALEFNVPTDWILCNSDEYDTTSKKSSDCYDRSYSNELTQAAVSSLNELTEKIKELNNAAISQIIPGSVNELMSILSNNSTNILVSNCIFDIIYGISEQLKKFSKSTTRSEFSIIKAECIEILLDDLNSLSDLIDNKSK